MQRVEFTPPRAEAQPRHAEGSVVGLMTFLRHRWERDIDRLLAAFFDDRGQADDRA